MSKKTITIEVPDGLPDGWECVGYGKPVAGETMHHQGTRTAGCWVESYGPHWPPVYLIARRTETPADWANKQQKLVSLVGFLRDDRHKLCLYSDGEHHLCDGVLVNVYAECAPANYRGKWIKPHNGKWINA